MWNRYTLPLAIRPVREQRQDALEKSHWPDLTLRLDSVFLIFGNAFNGIPTPARHPVYAKLGGSALVGMFVTMKIQQVRSAGSAKGAPGLEFGPEGAKALDRKHRFGRNSPTE